MVVVVGAGGAVVVAIRVAERAVGVVAGMVGVEILDPIKGVVTVRIKGMVC